MSRKTLRADDFGTLYELPRLEDWKRKRVRNRCKPPATVRWIMLAGTSLLVRYDVLAGLCKRLRGTEVDIEWPSAQLGNPAALVFRYQHDSGRGCIRLAAHRFAPAAKAVGAQAA